MSAAPAAAAAASPAGAGGGGSGGSGGGGGGSDPAATSSKATRGQRKRYRDKLVAKDAKLDKIERSIEKSLPNMMFGYGDSKRPLKSTAAVLGNLAIDFVGEMTKKMVALAADRGDGELTYQNLLFLIRDDAFQYDRAWELKTHSEELRRAQEIALAKDDATR
jgi:hypothetical protein